MIDPSAAWNKLPTQYGLAADGGVIHCTATRKPDVDASDRIPARWLFLFPPPRRRKDAPVTP
jgi:hypothetical protein